MKYKKMRFLTITSLIVPLLLTAGEVYANKGGIVGRTMKYTSEGCGGIGCHDSSPAQSVNVQISGPASLARNESAIYTLTITGGPAVESGCNIAVVRGQLKLITGNVELKLTLGELTQKTAKPFSGGSVTYEYEYKAASTAGLDTMYAIGLSSNKGDSTLGDAWNWAANKLIVVTSGGSAPAAPTLSSPANMAMGISTNPTLSWNESSGATSYGVQVSTTSSFSSTVYNASGITTTSANISNLMNNTTYYWRVNATNSFGTSGYSAVWSFTTGATSVERIDNEQPTRFVLSQNFPNPFNPITTIEFSLVHSGFVTLTIYDALGGEVSTLVKEQLRPGRYNVQWNAERVPSGVYFYRLDAGSFTQTRKLVLLR